ncbi:hypothetical protein JY651_45795 [Pyxidicoccus parkwayensis]|uniref:Uncharacterized protein n=1 Tax=Pyxidicoccus parkwayensis TaxID=2813578 RepID=A0ABX7NTY0_9BACT|nr:hypothetical protein [Pyxidicoccus parkwaysis]QSQ22361.1 hypothetical protein JY651_45795 [Pyxidicoccus parkwaysis]
MFLETGFPFPLWSRAPATPEEERIASQAAALRVFLHAAGAPEGIGMAALPLVGMPAAPMPLQEALAFLGNGRSLYARRAMNLAVARLSVAAYTGAYPRREPLLPALVALLGTEKAAELDDYFEKHVPDDGWKADDVRRILYGLELTDAASTRLKSGGGDPFDDITTFDPGSLITTVRLCAKAALPFEQLVRLADPRCWEKDNSLFWNCSRQVIRDAKQQDWVPAPTTSHKPVGSPWQGALFEEVSWSWNTDVGMAATFDVVLNIDCTAKANPLEYQAKFRLHQCLGSMLFGTTMGRGVEVDDGFQLIQQHPFHTTEHPLFRVCVMKRLRYSNLGDRRAYQGPPMSGALLNLMATSLVSLWLHDILDRFYPHPKGEG